MRRMAISSKSIHSPYGKEILPVNQFTFHQLSTHLIILRCGDQTIRWLLQPGEKRPVLLDDRHLRRELPDYADLTLKGRRKAVDRYLRGLPVALRARIDATLPNVSLRILGRPPCRDDFRAGADAFLRLLDLFEDPETGAILAANLLCGFQMTTLRQIFPAFLPAVSIPEAGESLEQILRLVQETATPKYRWRGKHCRVRRAPVLDYRESGDGIILKFQDFSRIKIMLSGRKSPVAPFPYTDTAALIIGASSGQIREAAPYLERCSVIALGCKLPKEISARRLSHRQLGACDPQIIEAWRTHGAEIALVLRLWQEYELPIAAIKAQVSSRFLPPDKQYIAVVPHPDRLRAGVYLAALATFLRMLAGYGLLSPEETAAREEALTALFFPPPPPPAAPKRQAEDPQVFLELLAEHIRQSPEDITGPDEPYRKKGTRLGAWRTISGTQHLVMAEPVWKKWYQKKVRSRPDLDTASLSRDAWEKDMQKALADAGIIKAPSAGFRYRYDLYDNGSRDSTYVLAVPAHLLPCPGKTSGKSAAAPAAPLPESLPEEPKNFGEK